MVVGYNRDGEEVKMNVGTKSLKLQKNRKENVSAGAGALPE